MAKANPLGNLNYERVERGWSPESPYHDVNSRGELPPVPGPTSRSDVELRKQGLSDTPSSEYTGGPTSGAGGNADRGA